MDKQLFRKKLRKSRKIVKMLKNVEKYLCMYLNIYKKCLYTKFISDVLMYINNEKQCYQTEKSKIFLIPVCIISLHQVKVTPSPVKYRSILL